MNSLPVALQMGSVREDFPKDFAATVKKSRRHRRPRRRTGRLRQSLRAGCRRRPARGRRARRGHACRPGPRLQADLDTVRSEAALLGSPCITCPLFDKTKWQTAGDCTALGETLNRIGAAVRQGGRRFAYHTHDGEFQKVDGRFVLDWILDAAEPQNLEIVYWSPVAGADTPAWLRQAGRRTTQIHLQDVEELGASGKVDFPGVLQAVESIDAAEIVIIEQEKYNHEPLESARLCLATFRSWTGT